MLSCTACLKSKSKQIANDGYPYSGVRCLMVSTDQADSRCFYFRISWILMERHWFYFDSLTPLFWFDHFLETSAEIQKYFHSIFGSNESQKKLVKGHVEDLRPYCHNIYTVALLAVHKWIIFQLMLIVNKGDVVWYFSHVFIFP